MYHKTLLDYQQISNALDRNRSVVCDIFYKGFSTDPRKTSKQDYMFANCFRHIIENIILGFVSRELSKILRVSSFSYVSAAEKERPAVNN